jgi:NAD(P)-dependent dehydrogenase (short-subunit alcohol dehydrogenase family)
MVTAGRPSFGRLIELDLAHARRTLDEHFSLIIEVARNAADKVKPGGTLIFMGGTGGRRPAMGLGILSTLTAALPTLTANLALELAPVRVNLIAAGFVDTQLSASLLAINSKTTVASCELNFPSGGLSNQQMSPHWPYIL